MSRWNDIDARMSALKADLEAITHAVRHLRKQKALDVIKHAEQQLIRAQRAAKSLNLPVAVLGAGQCKDQKQPYSLVKPKPRPTTNGKPSKPAQ